MAPVAQELVSGDLSVRPGHDGQGIAGEQLGARDDDQNQPEGKRNAAQQLGRTPAQFASSDGDGEKQSAIADIGAGQNRQHQGGQDIQPGLGDTCRLDAGCDLRGFISLDLECLR